MLAGVITWAGVFDVRDHYGFENARGVHEISPMKPARPAKKIFHAGYCSESAALHSYSYYSYDLP